VVTPKDEQRPKRPFSVSLLAIVVLTFTSLHLVRFVEVLRLWDFLHELLPDLPLFLALTGAIWGVIGLVLVWGLWRGHPMAPQATRLAALVYAGYYWIDHLWLAASIEERRILPFTVGVTLVLLGFIYWTLSRPRAKAFFGERHEQQR
jgi:hypothetical protein